MDIILQSLTLLFLGIAFLHLRNRLKRLERSIKDERKKIVQHLQKQKPKAVSRPAAPVLKRSCLIRIKDSPAICVDTPVPDPLKGGPFFSMGPHKSGTVLLNALLADLALAVKMPCADIPADLFSRGIDMSEIEEIPGLFSEKGILLTGFRTAWVGGKDITIPSEGKAVVLVRDPRDILVSLYFSEAKSHTLPDRGKVRDIMLKLREGAGNTDIDSWAIQRARSIARLFARWADWVAGTGPGNVKVFRYEDVIFQKEKWLSDMNKWFGWQAPADAVRQIAAKHDIRPSDEDAARHIRKVAPGDHIEKLKPETIAELNELLRGPAARFGYQL